MMSMIDFICEEDEELCLRLSVDSADQLLLKATDANGSSEIYVYLTKAHAKALRAYLEDFIEGEG